MTIDKTNDGAKSTLKITGRLDTATAPELEKAIAALEADVKELVLDFAELEYISSAGLRVVLAAQKKMNTQGSMVIMNANESVMEVFEITGFADIVKLQ
ncbi:MAG TPA: STAS domain-containing protein [Lachnospiraceae bacterium]|nr:STAS domain-containing protein [Lachnospiraceae bacterium]